MEKKILEQIECAKVAADNAIYLRHTSFDKNQWIKDFTEALSQQLAPPPPSKELDENKKRPLSDLEVLWNKIDDEEYDHFDMIIYDVLRNTSPGREGEIELISEFKKNYKIMRKEFAEQIEYSAYTVQPSVDWDKVMELINTIEGECQEAQESQENYTAENYIDSILTLIDQFKKGNNVE